MTVPEGDGQITRFLYDGLGNLEKVERKNDALDFVPFSTFTSDCPLPENEELPPTRWSHSYARKGKALTLLMRLAG